MHHFHDLKKKKNHYIYCLYCISYRCPWEISVICFFFSSRSSHNLKWKHYWNFPFAIFSTKNYGFDLGLLQSRKCMTPYFIIKHRFDEDPGIKIYQSMINQQQWRRTSLFSSVKMSLCFQVQCSLVGGDSQLQKCPSFKPSYAMSLLYIMISWWYHGWHWVDRYIGFKRRKAIHSYQQVNAILLGASLRVWKWKKRSTDLRKA